VDCRSREGGAVSKTFEAPFCTTIELVPVVVDVIAPLFALALALSNRSFAEKYPERSCGVVPETAILKLDAVDKFLVVNRDCFAVCSRHDLHTVLRPLDRRELAAGYHIIIAYH
jgi:hypothetical protein